MARPKRGPWRRGTKGAWYTTVGRKLVWVADKSATYEEAFQKFCEQHGGQPTERPEHLKIAALFARFLAWCKTHRAETTYAFYHRYLNSFLAFVPVKRVADLLPRHVENWIDREHDECSDTTKNDLMKGVNRAINWGIKKRYLKFNPLVGMEKPSRRPREVVLTQDQFRTMIGFVKDEEFRDYLEFLWQTGCRAMEVRIIEARHVDGSVVTLAASEAKGKRRPRTIYLNDVALAIVKRRCKLFPTGPIFRDTKGRPWTANTVRLRFKRRTKTKKGEKIYGLSVKMGIPGLCATTLRHSWATNALKNKTDVATASILMGHSDPATLLRNYQHLAKDQEFLQNAAKVIPISVPVPLDTGVVAPA